MKVKVKEWECLQPEQKGVSQHLRVREGVPEVHGAGGGQWRKGQSQETLVR